MIRTYAADRPFRVRFMPTSVGVAEGQRAAEIRISDFASFDEAMVGKDKPPAGYVADRITREADHVLVWPIRQISPGDAVWVDENINGGFVGKGVAVAFLGFNDRMDKLWQVRLDGTESLHPVPEKLLRPRD